MRYLPLAFIAAIVIVLTAACTHSPSSEGHDAHPGLRTYVPELGELMMLQQVRHTKLWLAGQEGNWKLAAYELDELREGFDAIVTFHPTHEDAPVEPKEAIPRMVTQPLSDLQSAVSNHDAVAFRQGYDTLTTACNNCHQATNVGFNRVQRPESNPYPDQIFSDCLPPRGPCTP
jgi:cytochrome c1